MRVALALALALACAAPAWGAAQRGSHRGRAPVAIGVSEREFRLTAYRRRVTPGRVRLNVENFGEDTHNLVVRGPRGYLARGPEVRPGQHATLAATLRRPGRYTLLCTLANHARLGMRTRITVRARRR